LKSSATDDVRPRRDDQDRAEHLQRIPINRIAAAVYCVYLLTFQPQHTYESEAAHWRLLISANASAGTDFLDNIDNVQSSWVTQGPYIGQIALRYGANDSALGNDGRNSSKQCGHNLSELDAAQIESLIHGAATNRAGRNNLVTNY